MMYIICIINIIINNKFSGKGFVSRFKGLGEMSAEQLWDTTLNPDTRRLLPVTLGTWTEDETIKNEITLSGVGLHTGNKVNMTFKPAPVNNGYVFKRIDLEGEPIIEEGITGNERFH